MTSFASITYLGYTCNEMLPNLPIRCTLVAETLLNDSVDRINLAGAGTQPAVSCKRRFAAVDLRLMTLLRRQECLFDQHWYFKHN